MCRTMVLFYKEWLGDWKQKRKTKCYLLNPFEIYNCEITHAINVHVPSSNHQEMEKFEQLHFRIVLHFIYSNGLSGESVLLYIALCIVLFITSLVYKLFTEIVAFIMNASVSDNPELYGE
jgi:hypothetical protein